MAYRVQIAAPAEQCVHALASYRYDRDGSQGDSFDLRASRWVEFFGAAVVDACKRAMEFEGRVADIRGVF